jgi:hypothetical protein
VNPCATSPDNTAACETLPSQIENFTTAFFGTVVKTEVDGRVEWSLPCNLEIGLPNNPRADGEGLACYFLRLFTDGITGLTGPQGDPGPDGADGKNAFGVTLQGFNQPSLASPNINILTAFNPSLSVGLYVFIQTSGWYLITNTDGAGGVWLTLVKSAGAVADGSFVSAGKLVIPSGYPGASITGPQGIQGPPGVQGPAGVDFTVQSSQTDESTIATVADHLLKVAMAEVDFIGGGAGELAVLLPSAGTYLITATVNLKHLDANLRQVKLELRDQGVGTLPGSTVVLELTSAATATTANMSVRYNSSGSHYIKVRGQVDVDDTVSVDKTYFALNYVKIGP